MFKRIFLITAITIAFPATSFAVTDTYLSPGSHVFTVPANVTDITVTAIGGGGGGDVYAEEDSDSGIWTNRWGGGGGSGGYAVTSARVSPGASYTVTVPAGGAGGMADSNGCGSDGEDGGIADILWVTGGHGGGTWYDDDSSSFSCTNTDLLSSGGQGGTSGGVAGTSGTHWDGSANGGEGDFVDTQGLGGSNGSGFGNGGDGANSGTAGVGQNGRVIITYTPNTPVITGTTADFPAGTFTFTVPANVYSLNATVIGGGAGGGGAGHFGDTHEGDGGGSGGYATQTIAVTPGQNINVTAGIGGCGGHYYYVGLDYGGPCPFPTWNGTAGGNSSFSGVTATGGTAGGWALFGYGEGATGAGGSPNGSSGVRGETYSCSNGGGDGGNNGTGYGAGGNGGSCSAGQNGNHGRVLLSWVVSPNLPPTVNAGVDRSIMLPTSTTTPSGATSTDPESQPVTYVWANTIRPSGAPLPTISNTTILLPTFGNLTATGTYTFRVVATDSIGQTATDTMDVVVSPSNLPPTANAGPDRAIVSPTSTSSLQGPIASDPEGLPVSIAWSLTARPSGAPLPTISSTTALTPTFGNLTYTGTYTFRIIATDSIGQTATDTMNVVRLPNFPPTANAGGDRTITLPTSVATTSGASASDPEGAPMTFSWSSVSRPTGAPVPTISSTTILAPTFSNLVTSGIYVFRLTVTDNNPQGSGDTMQVIVSPEPVANLTAGPITLDSGVLLQGANLTFSSLLNNPSTTSITTNFSHDFNYRWGTSGAWNQLEISLVTTGLNAGSSIIATTTTTLNASISGTLQVQHCADSNNAITESSELDNCSITTFYIFSGSVDASPATLDGGSTSTITWSTNATTSCLISGTNGDIWTVPPVPVNSSGVESSPLYADTTYLLQCNSTLIDFITIDVNTTPTLTVNRRSVDLSDDAYDDITFTWNTHNGDETSCTLTGLGISDNPLTTNGGNVNTGSYEVEIDAQSTFTLACPAGSDTVTIEVIPIGSEG